MKELLLIFGATLIIGTRCSLPDQIIFSYECHESKCVKKELTKESFNSSVSMATCKLFCGNTLRSVWPKPTGRIQLGKHAVHIDHNKIKFNTPQTKEQLDIWDVNKKRFLKQIEMKISDFQIVMGGRTVSVNVSVLYDSEYPRLTLDTDESYKLEIRKCSLTDEFVVNIEAKTFFGARHGIETLSQLIVYDNLRHELQMVSEVEIEDSPVFNYRGLLLDTARNWYSINAIKRTIDAMAMVKMNTFHWHITDSQSFPLEVKSRADLHKLGAYSSSKVYTHESVMNIVQYGRARGVRVLPEFDAPAHVGEGWQHFNMTICFNAQPWKKFCVEPPCGQLDPTLDKVYDVLEDIYREIFELFDPDIFHMGGDEVSTDCWNSSNHIRNWMHSQGWKHTEENFIKLWGFFQTKALNRVDKVSNNSQIPIVLWTSRLTDVPFIDEYINRERYIIQVWTESTNQKIQQILQRGFRVIISNYDALYLDCGGPSWVSSGSNWCSPYTGWQKIYDNGLSEIAGEYLSQILGAEAAVWSEQIGESSLDFKLWPRVSALAERLWSNPKESWRMAETRMLMHRERLFENGIGADTLQPEWCIQNEKECPIDAYDSKNSL